MIWGIHFVSVGYVTQYTQISEPEDKMLTVGEVKRGARAGHQKRG